MADNILAVLNGDRREMADRARACALEFSWDSSMEALFSRLYPAAFARRAEQIRVAPAGAVLAA